MSDFDFNDKPERSYEFKPRPGRRPEGGHKIVCCVCDKMFKTKPEDSLSYCQYSARAWGWKGDKYDKSKWRCPDHIKTLLQKKTREPVGGIVRLRSPLSTGLKRASTECERV